MSAAEQKRLLLELFDGMTMKLDERWKGHCGVTHQWLVVSLRDEVIAEFDLCIGSFKQDDD